MALRVRRFRVVLALLGAMLVSCATPQPVQEPGTAKTVYRHKESGEVIRIGADWVEMNGVRSALADCSDAYWMCARGGEISFKFPRTCLSGTWFADEPESELRAVQYHAHSGGGIYVTRSAPSLRYDWHPRHGLVSIGSDDGTGTQKAYWKASGPPRFQCTPPPPSRKGR